MPPTVVTIACLDDPRVEVFREVRDRDLRGRDRLFMAESEAVLRRLLCTPHRLHSMLLSPSRYERLAPALARLPAEVPVYVAPLELMTGITGFHIHRGVLAAGIRPRTEELAPAHALRDLAGRSTLRLVAAERLTNVDNIGAIFRNAAAFGVDGILLDHACCDPLYRKAIRVSMGHVLSVPYAVSRDWPGDLLALKASLGLTVVGAEPVESATPLWNIPRHPRLAVVFGSEGQGISEAAIAACDLLCQIPVGDQVGSLNVSVASAVFLYELSRGGGPTGPAPG